MAQAQKQPRIIHFSIGLTNWPRLQFRIANDRTPVLATGCCGAVPMADLVSPWMAEPPPSAEADDHPHGRRARPGAADLLLRGPAPSRRLRLRRLRGALLQGPAHRHRAGAGRPEGGVPLRPLREDAPKTPPARIPREIGSTTTPPSRRRAAGRSRGSRSR